MLICFKTVVGDWKVYILEGFGNGRYFLFDLFFIVYMIIRK